MKQRSTAIFLKRLFFVLLAANLVGLLWLWLMAEDQTLLPTEADQESGLILYSELSQAEQTALQQQAVANTGNVTDQDVLSLPAAENAPAVQAMLGQTPSVTDESELAGSSQIHGQVCAALGPFYAPDQAAAGAARLRDLGFEPTVRQTGGQLRSGYWVYLPPFTSREDAKIVAARLREQGIEDMFIVSDAENRNAISLGLYSTAERADRRAAFLGKLGYTPRIAERFRDATLYWLDYREPVGEPLDVSALGVLAVEPPPSRKTVPCSLQNR
ncbi:MAG TPA: SPOR domain-containing protein [Gammaproteobacteria bacterium]|nr:SPOR domain-containing protein [Gammaproteobacteria bacterium]